MKCLLPDAATMHVGDTAMTCMTRAFTYKTMIMHAKQTKILLLLKKEKVLLPLLVNSEVLLSKESLLLLPLLPLSWRGSVF